MSHVGEIYPLFYVLVVKNLRLHSDEYNCPHVLSTLRFQKFPP